jgi:chemotaxis protein methyltransferase CheR
MSVAVAISPTDLEFVCSLVHQRSAIVLDTRKEYLVLARLEPVARDAGLGGITELVTQLRAGAAGLAERVVDALTTNETSWFRDLRPFEVLREHVLPAVVAARAGDRKLRIWSAASSSGQELYSVAMLLREHFPSVLEWDLALLGTDISPTAVARAREGRYSQIEINRGLPSASLVRHFERSGAGWRVRDEVRAMTQFRPMNLAAPWAGVPPCDVVFLRNVLIYFDAPTKARIFDQVQRVLRPDGYLFLGAAETPPRDDGTWERLPYERAGCYRPNRT